MDIPIRPRRVAPAPAKFVTGSLLRHILVMTGTGAVGLMAIFVGDLANIVFLSLLGDEAVVAAVGYASSIGLVTISVGIGLAIAATTLVAPALGAGQRTRARRLTVNAHLATLLVSTVVALILSLSALPLLRLLGASGRTLDLAAVYLWIVIPSLPPLALGMTSSAILRSVGDARRAMYVTLAGAIVNTALDPIFIFGLGLGIQGAAIASAISRLVIAVIGLHGVIRAHDLMGRPKLRTFLSDAPAVTAIAMPAMLTNIATPVANAYVTAEIAPFGDSAVAGWAVIGRIIPVAFGAIYALSGTVGPIIGQNYGARAQERVQGTLTVSRGVMTAFTVAAWLFLALLAVPLARGFRSTDDAADLIILFCRWLSPLFVFLGALFVANAAFNTLGRPHLSTALNWGRATLGTVPFVKIGASVGGAQGVLVGMMIGNIIFGAAAVWLGYWLIDKLKDVDSS